MGTPRSGGSVFQLSRKESWEIKDHMVLRDIETPERFFAENLNDSGMFPWISLFYYPLFFAENLATKPLFTSTESDAGDFDRIGSNTCSFKE